MNSSIEIEDIEEMRQQQGIDDADLHRAIRGLQPGDFVKLTVRTTEAPVVFETLLVRITSIRGKELRGKLADGPASTRLSKLRPGSTIVFTTQHIHSVPKGPPNLE